jgi:hypothetical protein
MASFDYDGLTISYGQGLYPDPPLPLPPSTRRLG